MASTAAKGKTAAEEQLEQREAQQGDGTDQLKEQAKSQAKERDAALAAGKKVPKGQQDKLVKEGNIAGARRPSGYGSGAQAGFTDQLTRRDGQEAMEGHFVTIDRDNAGAKAGFEAAGLADNSAAGNHGVYVRVGDRDEKGYPVTSVVRLEDATFTEVTVPYESLTHSESRRGG